MRKSDAAIAVVFKQLREYIVPMLNVRERRRLAAQDEAIELIGQLGDSRAANLLNVDPGTIVRYLKRSRTPSTSTIIALRAAANGTLPGMEHSYWKGWRFSPDGKLYNPAGRPYTAGDLMAQEFERALIRALQNKVAELEARLLREAEATNTAANDPLPALSGLTRRP
jgi:hypothetical protein